VETAIKIARLFGQSKKIASPKIIVMQGAFHGRTMAAITAGDNPKSKEGFDPLLPGFVRVPFNDAAAIEAAIKADRDIAAVLIEPIQGESGIKVSSDEYLKQVRKICDDLQVLMMLDEVQCGMGRTGKFFGFEHAGIKPDVITLAKGLANGVPIGACIIRKPFCDLFKPGSHGSTFGGNPLSCAAGIATLHEIINNKFYDNAAKMGAKIIAGLTEALKSNQHVKAVRGKGLMIGVELDQQCREILPIAKKHGIIFNVANYNVLRLLPPLIINDAQAQQIIDTIPVLIEEYYDAQPA
jgi:acetylornithine aminotransferase